MKKKLLILIAVLAVLTPILILKFPPGSPIQPGSPAQGVPISQQEITEITPKALYQDSQLMELLTGKRVRLEGYFVNKDSIFTYSGQYRITIMENGICWAFQLQRGDISRDEIEKILEEFEYEDWVVIEGTLDGWGDYYGAHLDEEPIVITDKLTQKN